MPWYRWAVVMFSVRSSAFMHHGEMFVDAAKFVALGFFGLAGLTPLLTAVVLAQALIRCNI